MSNNKEMGADVLKKKLDELNNNVFKENQREKLLQINMSKKQINNRNDNLSKIDNIIGDMRNMNNLNDNRNQNQNINSFINKVKDETEQNNVSKR